jgi:hypothetical protein
MRIKEALVYPVPRIAGGSATLRRVASTAMMTPLRRGPCDSQTTGKTRRKPSTARYWSPASRDSPMARQSSAGMMRVARSGSRPHGTRAQAASRTRWPHKVYRNAPDHPKSGCRIAARTTTSSMVMDSGSWNMTVRPLVPSVRK